MDTATLINVIILVVFTGTSQSQIYPWSPCSKTCGQGTKHRRCNTTELPKCQVKYDDCTEQDCPDAKCPHGSVFKYGSASECCRKVNPNSCGVVHAVMSSRRIVGGKMTKDGQWPWLAALWRKSPLLFYCGGALINMQWVVTAAHCFEDPGLTAQEMTVMLGMRVQNGDNPNIQVREIEKYIKHPAYADWKNDIAILKLRKAVQYTRYVYPICMPNSEEPDQDTICHVASWGYASLADIALQRTSNDLLEAGLRTVPLDACKEAYRNQNSYVGVTNKTLCVGILGGGIDSCGGDSGSPLMCQRKNSCQWYFAGIVSFGAKYCGAKHTPAVYTKVRAYQRWIRNKIRSSLQTGDCKRQKSIPAGRTCRKPCKKRGDCSGRTTECLCDDDCGWSCFNPKAACAVPKSPVHGSIQYDRPIYGQNITYTCSDGYELKGQVTRICRSDKKWSGNPPQCVKVTNPCDSRPCLNGGICKNNGKSDFSCRCKPQYTGRLCESEERTQCPTNPCKNRGTCIMSGGGQFKCNCRPGFNGFLCETQVVSKSEVGKWQPCSKSCGGGFRFKLEGCENVQQSHCRKTYDGCNTHDCPALSSCPKNHRFRYKDSSSCCKTSAESCGIDSTSSATGNSTKWPWVAAMVIPPHKTFICTGTLLSKDWVVTVAYCFDHYMPSEMRVLLGTSTIRVPVSTHQTFEISLLIIHENYAYPHNDIALVKLSKSAVINSAVKPICLPSMERMKEGQTCLVAGHAFPTGPSHTPPDSITENVLSLLPLEVCKNDYRIHHHEIAGKIKASDHMCIGEYSSGLNRKYKCLPYMSGSALICQRCSSCGWYLAGLSEFGSLECGATPDVYVNVHNFEDWLRKKLSMPRISTYGCSP